MLITQVKLKNWRNFREFDAKFRDITYILGPNASGKSNLLDVFRFLRDISKPKGGGLQAAVDDRGGISKIRCLHARQDPEISIEVSLSESADEEPTWKYLLAFKSNKKQILITRESVWKNGKEVITPRPNEFDLKDSKLLTQTHLEQIQTNSKFRELADLFEDITYLHIVPQLLKFSEQIGGQILSEDPFGQGFMERVAKTPEKTRATKLKKIGGALKIAVPQFDELKFDKDELGKPHLHALYKHHRPNAGWQSEEHFSDGTLRLLGLLWSLLEGNALLLLEEPEISLNSEIVKQIPLIIHRLQRNKKHKRQIIISTHSDALLSNPGIDGRGVILLESGPDGTKVRSLNEEEKLSLDAGLSIAEVVLPKAKPTHVTQLGLWKI
ncbi:MAG: AAA family ATPase [Cellvibrio sp.]|nr:AAA family ATPase [Cellvibrio sp.]